MWNHQATDNVSIDETGCGTDYAAVAYCECGWQADHWHHADAYGVAYGDAEQAALDECAYAAAQADAQAHIAEFAACLLPRIRPIR